MTDPIYPPDPNCTLCGGYGEWQGFAYGGPVSHCVCTTRPRVDWQQVQGGSCFREMVTEFNQSRSSRKHPERIATMAAKLKAEFRDALESLELSDAEAADLMWTTPKMVRAWLEKVKPDKQIKVPNAQAFCILAAAMEDPDAT